jgi:glutamate-1-semialdehyde 2,1-aminomutase
VSPDLSCWSKAIANGYPLSVLLGSKSTRDGAATAFLSGTYWVQAVPMAASLATLDLIQSTDYLERTTDLGQRLRSGLADCARAHEFELRQSGPVQMPMIQFQDDPELRFSMAFASAMIRRGIYMFPHHNLFICAAMTAEDIAHTIEVADDALAEMSKRRSTIEPHPGLVDLLRGSESPRSRSLEAV